MDNYYLDSDTFNMAAGVICITCLFYLSTTRKRYRIRSRLFTVLVCSVFICCVADFISYVVVLYGPNDVFKQIVTYVCEMIYYFTHLGMVPVFVFYVIFICGVKYKFNKLKKCAIKFPFYVVELLILTNPFTNLIFVPQDNYVYTRGKAINFVFFLVAFYFFLSFHFLVRYWNVLNAMKKVAMIYFLLLIAMGALIQMFNPEIECELLCDSIGICGIMIMIEEDDDRTDNISKAFNRAAFVEDISSYLKLNRPFYAFCLRLNNIEMLDKIYGGETSKNLIMSIASFFMDDGNETNAYRTRVNSFFVTYLDKSESEIKPIIEKVADRFKENWDIDGQQIEVDMTLVVAKYPDQFNSIDDVFLLESADLKEKNKNVFYGSDLDFILRRIEVEKAFGRGLQDKKFRNYFIPLYGLGNLDIKMAETRLRLLDDEIQYITPDEFLEIAENSVFIEEMEILMIEEVCRFLSNGVDTSDMQIDCVLVPVISVTLLKQSVIERVSELIRHYNINSKLLGLVVRERDALFAREVVALLADGIKGMKTKIFLSDYQSGLLGLNTISLLDIDGVIINIQSIYGEEKIENADLLMQSRIGMLKELEKTVIVSGIDNKYYYEKIKDTNADFIEGAYLSAEISKNELQNRFWHGEHLLITDDGVNRFYEED